MPGVGTTTVSITATSALAFAPSQVTAPPGQNLQFTVTQAANFDHSFVLSPLVNFTFDPAASGSNITTFFRAHAPLVNLSLGSTVGTSQSAQIGPLAIGTYEFVCIVSGHFQAGMHGELTVSNSASSSAATLSPLLVGIVGVVVVVIVVAVVAVVLMRRRGRPPAAPAPPPPIG